MNLSLKGYVSIMVIKWFLKKLKEKVFLKRKTKKEQKRVHGILK